MVCGSRRRSVERHTLRECRSRQVTRRLSPPGTPAGRRHGAAPGPDCAVMPSGHGITAPGPRATAPSQLQEMRPPSFPATSPVTGGFSWPSGRQQAAAEQDQAGKDEQDREGVAARPSGVRPPRPMASNSTAEARKAARPVAISQPPLPARFRRPRVIPTSHRPIPAPTTSRAQAYAQVSKRSVVCWTPAPGRPS